MTTVERIEDLEDKPFSRTSPTSWSSATTVTPTRRSASSVGGVRWPAAATATSSAFRGCEAAGESDQFTFGKTTFRNR